MGAHHPAYWLGFAVGRVERSSGDKAESQGATARPLTRLLRQSGSSDSAHAPPFAQTDAARSIAIVLLVTRMSSVSDRPSPPARG
jgi:hypothetical protein